MIEVTDPPRIMEKEKTTTRKADGAFMLEEALLKVPELLGGAPALMYCLPNELISPELSINASSCPYQRFVRAANQKREISSTGFTPCKFSIAPNHAYRSTNELSSMNPCVWFKNDTISCAEHCAFKLLKFWQAHSVIHSGRWNVE